MRPKASHRKYIPFINCSFHSATFEKIRCLLVDTQTARVLHRSICHSYSSCKLFLPFKFSNFYLTLPINKYSSCSLMYSNMQSILHKFNLPLSKLFTEIKSSLFLVIFCPHFEQYISLFICF